MKKHIYLTLTIILAIFMFLTACSSNLESSAESPDAVPKASPVETPKTNAPTETDEPDSSPEPTPVESAQPTTEPGVILTNSPDSVGNTHYASSHYGLHIAYTGEYITVANNMKMIKHGEQSAVFEPFEYQAEDLQYYNDLLYFLNYDWNNGVYYLYTYDFENEPVKVCESTVYHYEFINGKIYYTKEFFQGPIYSMDLNGENETQISTMRAHSFVTDDQNLYFYSTDAGTAPGLVKYNLSTNEETTVVFPFYSHNYLVHSGYVYYVIDSTYRSIHRMSLLDQTVEDIWLEMTDYTISMNISDGMLYILSGNSIYKSNLDGSGRTKIYENEDSFQAGLYIFGDRVYCTDGFDLIMVKNDGSDVVSFGLGE